MGDEREPEGLKRIEVYASPEPIIEGVNGLARELVADIEKRMRDRFSEVKSEIKGMRRIDPQDRDAIVEGVAIQLRPVLAKAIAHGSVVRMLQLDIDHASVDVEQVQSIIRRNQKLRLNAIATQQNGDG